MERAPVGQRRAQLLGQIEQPLAPLLVLPQLLRRAVLGAQPVVPAQPLVARPVAHGRMARTALQTVGGRGARRLERGVQEQREERHGQHRGKLGQQRVHLVRRRDNRRVPRLAVAPPQLVHGLQLVERHVREHRAHLQLVDRAAQLGKRLAVSRPHRLVAHAVGRLEGAEHLVNHGAHAAAGVVLGPGAHQQCLLVEQELRPVQRERLVVLGSGALQLIAQPFVLAGWAHAADRRVGCQRPRRLAAQLKVALELRQLRLLGGREARHQLGLPVAGRQFPQLHHLEGVPPARVVLRLEIVPREQREHRVLERRLRRVELLALDAQPLVGLALGVRGALRAARGLAPPRRQQDGVALWLLSRVELEAGRRARDEREDALVTQRIVGVAPNAHDALEELAQLARVRGRHRVQEAARKVDVHVDTDGQRGGGDDGVGPEPRPARVLEVLALDLVVRALALVEALVECEARADLVGLVGDAHRLLLRRADDEDALDLLREVPFGFPERAILSVAEPATALQLALQQPNRDGLPVNRRVARVAGGSAQR